MKFSIGDQVVEKSSLRAHTTYNVMKVVVILGDSFVLEHYGYGFDGEVNTDTYVIPLGARGWREAFKRYREEELFTLEETVQELHRLEAAETKLNEEFEAVRYQIQAKLNSAALLAREAGEIAKAYNKKFFDLKEDCMPLYKALAEGGWSHSHMKC